LAFFARQITLPTWALMSPISFDRGNSMTLMTKAVATADIKLPKVIHPKGHAICDYVHIGMCTVMGALFWKENRCASVAAFCCAVLEAANALLTDYPGGVTDVLSFETHGRIDAAMAGTMTSLPNLLGFGSEAQATHFRIGGTVLACVAALTDFKNTRVQARGGLI
jgi:hypothetical protein